MRVKKPIRRRKSTTVLNKFTWMSKPAVWTRTVKQLTHAVTSMNTPTVAAGTLTGAMIAALLVVGYRTTPANVARVDEQPTAPAVQQDATTATPPTAPAVGDARAAAPTTEARVATPQMVTIAGCLAQDGESFRLKDTSGVDAPRSRSWKSGFLKKGPAAVEVVDASHRLKFTSHVGERVSVTGNLVDGEMQVRSLRRVATSCTESKPKAIA